MKYIRTFAVLFSFAIFYAGALILNFFVFPCIEIFARNNKKQYYSQIIYTCWGLFVKFLEFIGILKINIKDKEKLQSIKNKIIVSTHPSYIDVLILMSLIPNSTCFVKKELAYNPILKNLVNSIFITNEVELEELKSESKKMLDLGFNVIIFPSGIRHRRNEFPKIKKGASLIALNANKNIVPIRFFSNNDFMFINQPFYEVGEKRVTFEIEQMPEINVQDFISASEIVSKKKITQQIEKSLYNS